jgi:hypothetical protein
MIRSFLDAVARDLPTGEPSLELNLVSADDIGPTPPHSSLTTYPEAALLVVDGVVKVEFLFWRGEDLLTQMAVVLDQVQDVVIESTREQWPVCTDHSGHPMAVSVAHGWLAWRCPLTGSSKAIGQYSD